MKKGKLKDEEKKESHASSVSSVSSDEKEESKDIANPDLNEDKEENPDVLKEKQNKQIMWAVILILAMIVIILAVPYVNNNYFNTFDYKGLDFQKTKLGKIQFYSTRIPILVDNPGTTITTGFAVEETKSEKKLAGTYAVNLRKDPRKSDSITIDMDINNITFIKGRTVYASYNSTDPACQHNVISAAELARFLIDFGGLNVEGAVINKEYAEQNRIPYATCETNPLNTVILIKNGNENKISRIKENCYELQYKECDILPVIEKFILIVLEGYMNSLKG